MRFDKGDLLPTSKTDCSPKHHVYRGSKEEWSDEKEGTLEDEGCPCLIVVVRPDAASIAANFAYN